MTPKKTSEKQTHRPFKFENIRYQQMKDSVVIRGFQCFYGVWLLASFSKRPETHVLQTEPVEHVRRQSRAQV